MERPPADPWESQRRRMILQQIMARGIRSRRLLAALHKVPRHRFVPQGHRALSYDDRPLSVGEGQTISQPYIVAPMTEQLQVRPGSKVLEVGTGSGYQAAILACMGARVYSVERIPSLAKAAAQRLQSLGYSTGVAIRVGDGSLGWPEEAPFDGILVTAYARAVPDALAGQLGEGGRMVIPLGEFLDQRLVVVERSGGALRQRDVCGCLFVPLIGEGGWSESEIESQGEA